MKRLMKLLVLSLVAMCAATGCNEKKETPAASAIPQPVRPTSTVVVPGSVKGKWKAVKIRVADKVGKKHEIYTLEIGKEFRLPGSGIALKVENFFPSFVMDGTTMTSQGNDLKNPAAELVVTEGGQEIFNGWIFALYPTTHAFQHPQFGFTLVDYVPKS